MRDLRPLVRTSTKYIDKYGFERWREDPLTEEQEEAWAQEKKRRDAAIKTASRIKNRTSKAPLLSIVIPSLASRSGEFLTPLLQHLEKQLTPDVEILCLIDNMGMSVGRKMNCLLQLAQGRYVARVDDDDWLSPKYIYCILEAIKKDPQVDVITFAFEYRFDGEPQAVVFSGIDLEPTREGEIWHTPIDPKLAIRRDLLEGLVHPDASEGEDWAVVPALNAKLKTEHAIDDILYVIFDRGDNNPDRTPRRARWGNLHKEKP